MRAGPPFPDILVAARLILRDQPYTSKDQRRLMLGSQEKAQKSRPSRAPPRRRGSLAVSRLHTLGRTEELLHGAVHLRDAALSDAAHTGTKATQLQGQAFASP